MKVVSIWLAIILMCAVANAQQQRMDTILILDYWERPEGVFKSGKGFSEDYLEIIINVKDTINLNAKTHRKKIRFRHSIRHYSDHRKISNRLFAHNIRFAGLQIIKPQNESLLLHVSTKHSTDKEYRNKNSFDTTITIGAFQQPARVLWNLYDFFAGIGSGPNYFYHRYTLHSHNWPTPQQWAKYRKRRKVLKQIENAIVYRYNTVTGQIVKS